MLMRLLSVPWMWSDVDEMSWENEIEEIKEEMCMENQNEMFKGFEMENDTNMKEENVMKETIKSALSKGVSAMLNRTLTSGANASSSYYLNQPVEPASLKKFKKTR